MLIQPTYRDSGSPVWPDLQTKLYAGVFNQEKLSIELGSLLAESTHMPTILLDLDTDESKTGLWVTVPKTADLKEIDAAMKAHDPTPEPPRPDPREVHAKAIEQATTLAEVKAALAAFVRGGMGAA